MIETLLNNAPELWAFIGVIIGTLVLVIGGFAVTALAGTKMLEYGKMFWAEVKGQRAKIYSAVDEASDTIPQEIAKLTPFPDSPEMWSAMLKAAVEVVLSYTPPVEVNVTAPPADVAKAVRDEVGKLGRDLL
jgi:hypothetical protein